MRTTLNINDEVLRRLKNYAKDQKMSFAAAFRYVLELGLEDLRRNPDKEPPTPQLKTSPLA
jgi:hypothetical protein